MRKTFLAVLAACTSSMSLGSTYLCDNSESGSKLLIYDVFAPLTQLILLDGDNSASPLADAFASFIPGAQGAALVNVRVDTTKCTKYDLGGHGTMTSCLSDAVIGNFMVIGNQRTTVASLSPEEYGIYIHMLTPNSASSDSYRLPVTASVSVAEKESFQILASGTYTYDYTQFGVSCTKSGEAL